MVDLIKKDADKSIDFFEGSESVLAEDPQN